MQPPYPTQQITALILAGGKAARMGGADKGLVTYRGKPLVQHVGAVLRPQASTVLLSANRSHAGYRALGFEPLPDLRPGFPGPLAGIEAALAVCDTNFLLVCPCDTPHIPNDYGSRLWRSLVAGQSGIAFAVDTQRCHYLHMLISVTEASDLSGFLDSEHRAVRHWLARQSCAKARFSADELANLNSLEQTEG
jgi:molybdopterin-guanine dinucleotide biosynthesis protein A